VPEQRVPQKIIINVGVNEDAKGNKTLTTEMDVDGEVFTHESLMTEHDEGDVPDSNIEELRNLLGGDDDNDDHPYNGVNGKQLEKQDSNKSLRKVKDENENV